MKIRMTTVFVSLFVTALILFGGYFAYMQVNIEKPLTDYVASMEGVTLEEIEVAKNDIRIRVVFADKENLLSSYRNIKQKAEEKAGMRNVYVEMADESGALNELWEKEYFFVAEAVENKEYSRIPSIILGWQTDYRLNDVQYAMDEKYVYIYLQKDKERLFRAVPIEKEAEKA